MNDLETSPRAAEDQVVKSHSYWLPATHTTARFGSQTDPSTHEAGSRELQSGHLPDGSPTKKPSLDTHVMVLVKFLNNVSHHP